MTFGCTRMATRSSDTRSKILIFKNAALGFVAEIGGLYAAFEAARERPDAEVAAVFTEPAWEDRMETGDGSCEDEREERKHFGGGERVCGVDQRVPPAHVNVRAAEIARDVSGGVHGAPAVRAASLDDLPDRRFAVLNIFFSVRAPSSTDYAWADAGSR